MIDTLYIDQRDRRRKEVGENRKKRIAKLKTKNPYYGHKPIMAINLKTKKKKKYKSIQQASEELSLSFNMISKCVVGKRLDYRGYEFEHIDERLKEKYRERKERLVELKNKPKKPKYKDRRYKSKLKLRCGAYKGDILIKEYSTLTQAATDYGLKGKYVRYLIDNNLPYGEITFKL